VVFGAQSPEGLGDERQQWRLLHTVGGGLVLHQTPDPDALVQLAGTVRTPEQAWQLDPWGPAGQARVHMTDRPRVDPNLVRQLHPGEAFLIQAGRAVKLSVLQAPVPASIQEEASGLRAAAISAVEPVYVAEGIVGAPPQVELWRPNRHTLDQPDQPLVPALEAPRRLLRLRNRPGHRPCPPCPANASCSPSAKPSPCATRPWPPPSSKPANAKSPSGTPPPSWTASRPSAAGDAGDAGRCSRGSSPRSPTWSGCAVADPALAQGRRLARSLTSNNANNTSASPNAATPSRFRIVYPPEFGPPTAGLSLPRQPPRWPTRALARVRAGRGSTFSLCCRLRTLHPASPADLLAGRQLAARPLQGQGRSVPPCGPVLPSLRDGRRPPLTPPGPARSGDQRRPRWARTSRPASSKGR
jgi:hypothetical protein